MEHLVQTLQPAASSASHVIPWSMSCSQVTPSKQGSLHASSPSPNVGVLVGAAVGAAVGVAGAGTKPDPRDAGLTRLPQSAQSVPKGQQAWPLLHVCSEPSPPSSQPWSLANWHVSEHRPPVTSAIAPPGAYAGT